MFLFFSDVIGSAVLSSFLKHPSFLRLVRKNEQNAVTKKLCAVGFMWKNSETAYTEKADTAVIPTHRIRYRTASFFFPEDRQWSFLCFLPFTSLRKTQFLFRIKFTAAESTRAITVAAAICRNCPCCPDRKNGKAEKRSGYE